MYRKIVIPLVMIAAAALGCSQLRDSDTANSGNPAIVANANNAVVSAPVNAVSPTGDPVAEINAMADKFLTQKSFRAKMTGKGDKDFSTDVAFAAPDRFLMKTGPGMETIIIGKDVYLLTGDSWQKLPGGLGDSVPDLRAAFDKEGRKWFSDVRYVGEETANGQLSHVYEYKNRGTGNAGENDSKVWITKSDGLPVRIETRYKGGNLRSMVVEYRYDPNIKIDPPSIK